MNYYFNFSDDSLREDLKEKYFNQFQINCPDCNAYHNDLFNHLKHDYDNVWEFTCKHCQKNYKITIN